MSMLRKIKKLWRILDDEESLNGIDKQVSSCVARMDVVSSKMTEVEKGVRTLELHLEKVLGQAQTQISEVLSAQGRISEEFSILDESIRSKAEELHRVGTDMVEEVRRQVTCCREQADELIPEIRKISEEVQRIND